MVALCTSGGAHALSRARRGHKLRRAMSCRIHLLARIAEGLRAVLEAQWRWAESNVDVVCLLSANCVFFGTHDY